MMKKKMMVLVVASHTLCLYFCVFSQAESYHFGEPFGAHSSRMAEVQLQEQCKHELNEKQAVNQQLSCVPQHGAESSLKSAQSTQHYEIFLILKRASK